MASQLALTLVDIAWLRSSASKAGALGAPQPVATRLLAGKFVVQDKPQGSLKITPRGQLALTRLS